MASSSFAKTTKHKITHTFLSTVGAAQSSDDSEFKAKEAKLMELKGKINNSGGMFKTFLRNMKYLPRIDKLVHVL